MCLCTEFQIIYFFIRLFNHKTSVLFDMNELNKKTEHTCCLKEKNCFWIDILLNNIDNIPKWPRVKVINPLANLTFYNISI